MTTLDWIVVALYFVLTFVVAIVVTRRAKTRETSDGYFLAGRNAGWFIVGASLFASNIGAEHLVGLAGTGAATGIAVAQFEIMAGLVLLLLGWFFVPFYLRSGVYTMPEFLERRYSSGPRMYLAVVSIVSYVLTKISVTIAAGGIVFEALMGINFWTGATIVVLATGVYTLFGGLKAVLYTDAMQMFVLLLGAIVVTVLGLQAVGGWDQLVTTVGPERFDLWQPSSHPDFPWTGILFGAPILGIWYWCTDQFIVQRVLAARNQVEARRGAIFAGLIKQLPLFIFVLPGMLTVSGGFGRDLVDDAQLVQRYLKDVGIDAELKIQEHGAYMATTTQGKFEGLVRGPFGIAWEPDAPLYRTYAADSSWNAAHLNDPKITAMLKEQRRTKDLQARRKIIHDIQRYAAEQQYYVYTNVVMITASWAPYVKNYGPNMPFDYGSRVAALWLER